MIYMHSLTRLIAPLGCDNRRATAKALFKLIDTNDTQLLSPSEFHQFIQTMSGFEVPPSPYRS